MSVVLIIRPGDESLPVCAAITGGRCTNLCADGNLRAGYSRCLIRAVDNHFFTLLVFTSGRTALDVHIAARPEILRSD